MSAGIVAVGATDAMAAGQRAVNDLATDIEHLARLAIVGPLNQFLDRLRLVTGGLILGDELEPLAAFGLVRSRRFVGHELQ